MAYRRVRAAVALALTLGLTSSCIERDPANGNFAVAANGWYRGDLHYHTNYSEDARSQGGDSLGLALEIADAYRDPTFLAAYPEHAGDGLDFIAVTDHRTDAALRDPALAHPHLIVVPGEEYGGRGHANVLGLRAHIPHQPQQGESQDSRHVDAITEAHAQGAIFSVNHPCQENRWVWDMERIDALEVWNAAWALMWRGSTTEELDQDVASLGAENPYIRSALTHQGGGSNDQALHLWYNLLSRGRHVAVVGGGDRHMVVPAGLPTTYVRRPSAPRFAGLEGKSLGWEGIVEGIREGGTFVSRSPHGAQIDLEAVDADGKRYPLGARVPQAPSYALHIRVGRANGGVLRLIAGPRIPGDGPVAAQPEIVFEQTINRPLEELTYRWNVPAGGGWIHAIVLERLLPRALPEEIESVRASFQKLPEGDGLVGSIAPLLTLLDIEVLFDGSKCRPAEWMPFRGQCMPVDNETGGTFYIQDELVRLLNTYFENGQPTDWAMGAISSAFLTE